MRASLIAAALLMAGPFHTAPAVAREGKPNIIVIMTDDQTAAQLHVMTKTKHLLAHKGITFTNSFTDFPLCCPSRATFMTGQAAHNHGVRGNGPARHGGYERFKPTEGNSLPVWLRNAGYTTFAATKLMNGYGGRTGNEPSAVKTHIPPGWDEWFGKPDYAAVKFYDYDLNENGTIVHYGCANSDYETDVYARKARDFILNKQASAAPLFMWIAPLAPHTGSVGACPGPGSTLLGPKPARRHLGAFSTLPIPRPKSFNEADMSDKPSFMQAFTLLPQAEILRRERVARESLLAVDDLVEKVVQTLEQTGRLDNSLIIFTADNGYTFARHRLLGKTVPYEESTRVPLIVRGPGIPPGQTRARMVSNTDVVATILAAANAAPGRVLDGRSLFPLMENAGAAWRTALLIQGYNQQRRDGETMVGPPPPFVRYEGVRTMTAKYVKYANGEEELYDLVKDPYETASKHDDPAYAGRKAFLARTLAKLRDCAGAGCWVE